ncbi:hypothetical protein CCACVL1_22318 [Corchorus capsularis]|uniref:Uncharacterized protein n=1 Tax=Corchorus capsularis TaxID=210143 RepID=A0A1R3H096_COCAP|nr:hypothetical protein CCACVL1_22318 [Corchorus capsularis]
MDSEMKRNLQKRRAEERNQKLASRPIVQQQVRGEGVVDRQTKKIGGGDGRSRYVTALGDIGNQVNVRRPVDDKPQPQIHHPLIRSFCD